MIQIPPKKILAFVAKFLIIGVFGGALGYVISVWFGISPIVSALTVGFGGVTLFDIYDYGKE